jgi:hypothetical protein
VKLIDADKLLGLMSDLMFKEGFRETMKTIIKNTPTVDAVPVVRCKDCKHYNTIGCSKGFGWCENMDRGVSDNFYCANGKQLWQQAQMLTDEVQNG